MNREQFYELLDIESAEDFQYFENLAAFFECEEELDYEDIAALFGAVDQAVLAELIDEYFEEITNFVPGSETEVFSIFENVRRALVGQGGGLRPHGAEVPWHHAAAAGGCGARYVRERAGARCGWRADPQHHPLLRADLRAGRPGADENRADRGRRYPAEGRGGRFGGRLSASPNPLKRDKKKRVADAARFCYSNH